MLPHSHLMNLYLTLIWPADLIKQKTNKKKQLEIIIVTILQEKVPPHWVTSGKQ